MFCLRNKKIVLVLLSSGGLELAVRWKWCGILLIPVDQGFHNILNGIVIFGINYILYFCKLLLHI